MISYKDWGELKDDAAKNRFINNLVANTLNSDASIFIPSKTPMGKLNVNAPVFTPKAMG